MGAQNFYDKMKSDPAYQAKFLKDPIGVLASEGITLSAKNQKELLQVIDEILKPYHPGPGVQPKLIP